MIKKFIRFVESISNDEIEIISEQEFDDFYQNSRIVIDSDLCAAILSIITDYVERQGLTMSVMEFGDGERITFMVTDRSIYVYIFSDSDYYIYVNVERKIDNGNDAHYESDCAKIDISEGVINVEKFINSIPPIQFL